jgi:hypothetical protein
MTLWPISMFSRILAGPGRRSRPPSRAVPTRCRPARARALRPWTPRGRRAAPASMTNARAEGQAALGLDESVGCSARRFAEVGDGGVVDVVEGAPELLDHLRARGRRAGRSSWQLLGCSRGGQLELAVAGGSADADLDEPAGLVDELSGAQVAHRPETRGTSQVWQIPMRQPWAGLSPASSATRSSGGGGVGQGRHRPGPGMAERDPCRPWHRDRAPPPGRPGSAPGGGGELRPAAAKCASTASRS